MFALAVRRLLSAIPSLFGVLVITFVISRMLPGDPAAFYAGPAATAETIARTRAELGLDQPLLVQFWNYVKDMLAGDLGTSLSTGQSVSSDLLSRLPASIEVTLYALVFAIAVAIPLGIFAALRPNSWVDNLCSALVTSAAACPSFFVALLLLFIFYYHLGWAPSPGGRLDIFIDPPRTITGLYTIDGLLTGQWETARAAFAQLLLPAISLGFFALAPLARMMRACLLTVLSSEFITAARANGLSGRTVLGTYAMRNAMLPVINVLGMVFSFLLGANVIIEQVYAWPGIGSYAVGAVTASDYAAIQGFVLMMACIYVLLNLCIDLVNMLVDPRVRYEN